MSERPRADRLCDEIEATIAKLHDQVRQLRSAAQGENPVGKAIAAWVSGWKHCYGADYEPTKADTGNIKRLVTKHGAEEVISRLRRYAQNKDQFLVKQRHPLSIFFSQWNTYASGTNGQELELEAAPVDCRHTPRCQTERTCTGKAHAARMRA